jgi:hypothetical protein
MIVLQPPDLWEAPFKDLFCTALAVAPEHYERKVFWRILHRHALPFAFFIVRRNPRFFDEDFYLIREVGNVRDPQLFTQELNYFHGRNHREKGWLRGTWGIRVSAKRLIRLKTKVFEEQAALRLRQEKRKPAR